MELLYQEEQKIDLKVLHHQNSDDYQKKLKKFRRTVMAVYEIVSKKLYKSKSSSLENYFRDSWKISRAQVYRFLDCALVLEQLDGFTELPCRERLCRSLKRLAKKRSELRLLWESVLSRTDNNQELVTSTVIDSVWQDLLSRKLVTGEAETNKREELKNTDMWCETSAATQSPSVLKESDLSDPSLPSPLPDQGSSSSSSSVIGSRPPMSLLSQATYSPIPSDQSIPNGFGADSRGPMMIPSMPFQPPLPRINQLDLNHMKESDGPNNSFNKSPLRSSFRWIQHFQPDHFQRSGLPQQAVESLTRALEVIYKHGYGLSPYVDGKPVESTSMQFKLVSSDPSKQQHSIDLTEPLPPPPTLADTPSHYPYPTQYAAGVNAPPPGYYYPPLPHQQLPPNHPYGAPMAGQPGYWIPPPPSGQNSSPYGYYPPTGAYSSFYQQDPSPATSSTLLPHASHLPAPPAAPPSMSVMTPSGYLTPIAQSKNMNLSYPNHPAIEPSLPMLLPNSTQSAVPPAREATPYMSGSNA